MNSSLIPFKLDSHSTDCSVCDRYSKLNKGFRGIKRKSTGRPKADTTRIWNKCDSKRLESNTLPDVIPKELSDFALQSIKENYPVDLATCTFFHTM